MRETPSAEVTEWPSAAYKGNEMRRWVTFVAVVSVAATAAGCASVQRQGARSSASPKRPAADISRVSAPLTYASVGVALTPPPDGYRPAVSRPEVLTLLRQTNAKPFREGTPTVRLRTVSTGHPSSDGYSGWVITFHRTRPGRRGLPSPGCTFVSIYNLQNRIWTWQFQNCRAAGGPPSCNYGCTPANEGALDAAANYAEKVAGAAHRFTGDSVDDQANKVVVYLTHAPRSVIKQLHAAHPGIYVIHNAAPRTLHTLLSIEKSFNFSVLKPEGIQVVSVGPNGDGYLQVGVTSKVPIAQARLDAIYGPNIIRVVHAEPIISGVSTGPALHFPPQGRVAIRSTQSRRANAAEVRQWRKKPLAVTNGGSVIGFVQPGDGCRPTGISAAVEGVTLMLVLRPDGDGCTLPARFYWVTVALAKPVLRGNMKSVVERYGKFGQQQLGLS